MNADSMTEAGGTEAGAGLGRRMAHGAAWMIGLRFADRGVGFVSMIVLARLLVPADFGLVALAMAMVAAIAVFGEFGFEMALIQNQKTDRRHYDTAWTLGVLRGIAAGIIIALTANLLAQFFEDPRLDDVIWALALVPVLEGLYNVGTVEFRKELRLNKEFIFRIVPRIAGVLVTITFALVWRNYWALVAGTLTGASMRLVMSYAMQSFRPRLSLAALGEIMDFSKWMLVNSIVAFANKRADTFVIAKFLDAAALGAFTLSREISNMASTELLAPIKQALFPGYSKIAHDIDQLRKAFLDVFGILVLVALPIAIGIGLTSVYFVPILLGPKWLNTIPLIQILVITGGIRSVTSHVRPVYLAMNRPNLGAYASIGRLVVFLPVLFLSLHYYGIMGAAVAHGVAQVAVLFGSLYLMHRLLALGLGDVVRACGRPIVACILMVLAVGALEWYPPVSAATTAGQAILLLTATLLGAVVYCGSLLALWQLAGRPRASAEAYFLDYAASRLRKGDVAA